MSAELNIIDIVSSVMRGVNLTLRSMCGIVLNEMPSIQRAASVLHPHVLATDGTFSSVVTFIHSADGREQRGAVVLYIGKNNIKKLFGAMGVDSDSSDDEIKDVCGEFCNVIAGSFKTELTNINKEYSNVQLSVPSNYANIVNETIAIEVLCKYTASFSKYKEGLFTMELYLEGSQ